MLERSVRSDDLSGMDAVTAVGLHAGTIVAAVDALGANAGLLGQLSLEASKRGFRPLFVEGSVDLSFAEMSATVPGLRGVIIASDLIDPQAFTKADRPIVLISDVVRDDLPFDQVISDAEQSGNRAAEYVASAGRTSVAVVGRYDSSRPAFRGFLKGVSTYDLVVKGDHVVECVDDRRAAAEQFNFFLQQVSSLPQAVYCTSGDVACGVYEALLAAGFAVPNDMWIVGIGLSHMTGGPFYDITTIAPSNEALAAEAVDLLAARVEAAGRRPEVRRVAYETTPGITTGYFNVVRSAR